MSGFAGTGELARAAFRRDALWIFLWLTGLAAGMVASSTAMLSQYPTRADRTAAAAATNTLALRVIRGVATNATPGALTMAETFVIFSALAALMTIITVVRHTRQDEDSGRAELVGAAPIGRLAPLAAAMLVALGANVGLAGVLALVLVARGLPASGAWAAGLGIGAIGLSFAGVAAVAAQLAGSARGARGLAGAALAIAYLARGVGDGLGQPRNEGTSLDPAWPSWLSPIGWGQRIRPYGDEAWWMLGLHAGMVIITVGAALVLMARRDFGRGLLPSRRGSAVASPFLLSPLGLAWRLQRGALSAWAIGMVVAGVAFGSLGQDVGRLVADNERLAQTLADLSRGDADLTDTFFAAMMGLMGAIVAGYALQALLQLAAEESSGRIDLVLAASISRQRWMASHGVCALFGIIVLALLLGLSAGITDALVTQRSWAPVATLSAAGLVQTPAIFVHGAYTIAIEGFFPRRAVMLSWAGLAVALVFGPLGELLSVPASVRRASPFTYLPAVPAEPVRGVPIITLLAIAVGLSVAGIVAFRRRDTST